MKTLTLTLFLCLAPVVTLLADVVEVPNDLPTIEALISLHKLIKGEEDKALAQVTASYGSQSLVTKGATKFNAARSTLDSKRQTGHESRGFVPPRRRASLRPSAHRFVGVVAPVAHLVASMVTLCSCQLRLAFHVPDELPQLVGLTGQVEHGL